MLFTVVHSISEAYNPATNKLQEDIQVSAQTCSCRFYTKFAYCVHSIFAMQTRARIDGNGDEVLVNRRKRKAVGTAPTRAGRGRPPRIGRALERE
ncbi:Zinc finger, SWIM-type [Phytophthora cactorum]|nr:Zinc finger, SWIM-type [Phytophthora cactorum]